MKIASAKVCTYDINELHESKPEANVDLLCHVLNGPDEFVVSSEQVSDESFLILASDH